MQLGRVGLSRMGGNAGALAGPISPRRTRPSRKDHQCRCRSITRRVARVSIAVDTRVATAEGDTAWVNAFPGSRLPEKVIRALCEEQVAKNERHLSKKEGENHAPI